MALSSTQDPAQTLKEIMETHIMAASYDSGTVDEAFQQNRKARKEYKCHACDKVFKRSEHFTRHVRVHTKERPFSCRFCQKTYGRKDLVRRHEKTLHAELCEMAAADITPRTNARQESARRESASQPDFNQPGFPMNQPYPTHESQDGQLYSPSTTDQISNYDETSAVPPPSVPEPGTETLMIDPMLESAFGGQGFPSSDRFAQDPNGLYHDAGLHQASPYYHHQPNTDTRSPPNHVPTYDGDLSSVAHPNHDPTSPHVLHRPSDASNSNPPYGAYHPYQQPYPPDYQ